jgi:hypothetical protein
MHDTKLGFFGALALLAAGCHHGDKALLDLAAHDLQCPRDSIVTFEEGKHRRDVEGCGKRASYARQGKVWVSIDGEREVVQPTQVMVVPTQPSQGAAYGQPVLAQPPYGPPQLVQQQPAPYAVPAVSAAGYIQVGPGGAAQPR